MVVITPNLTDCDDPVSLNNEDSKLAVAPAPLEVAWRLVVKLLPTPATTCIPAGDPAAPTLA